jgi:F-type H+-transporting ATPase subunit b
MLIDWFTVGAQVLNFLVLVALLKRFLYRPVLDAIDAREQRIASQLADARTAQEGAARDRDEFQRQQADLENRREALLNQATLEADVEGRRLMEAARAQADAETARRLDAVRVAEARQRSAVARRTRDEVFAISRKALADLADMALDDRIDAALQARIAALDPAALAVLASGLDTRSPRVVVRSAFEMAPERQQAWRRTVAGLLRRAEAEPGSILVEFQQAPELVAGVELIVGGRRIGWNIEQFMDGLERATDAVPSMAATSPTAADPAVGELAT